MNGASMEEPHQSLAKEKDQADKALCESSTAENSVEMDVGWVSREP